ncbi:MAG TPA: hypothetical protein VFQ45_12375 [Longimicrobium sp.]|nr:hypothetical protein [Longimicrobium sp.]
MRLARLASAAVLGFALCTGAPDAHAQGDGLSARMRAFVEAVVAARREEVAAFFPRRGDWAWVQTWHDQRGGRRWTRVWRFPGPETLRAIGRDGPACGSFDRPSGEVGPFEGSLGMRMRRHDDARPWRRVRGNRFVPPDDELGWPGAFVEWRREDGRWVVSAIGDDHIYFPRLRGEARGGRGTFVHADTALPLPPSPRYAAGEEWFTSNGSLLFRGYPYQKYGLPRPIEPAELVRVGRVGLVGVYAEAGRPGTPEVIYAAASPGQYQPYQTFLIHVCGR